MYLLTTALLCLFLAAPGDDPAAPAPPQKPDASAGKEAAAEPAKEDKKDDAGVRTALAALETTLKKGEFLKAFDGLSDNGRKLVGSIVSKAAPMLGLNPRTATTREIVAAFEKQAGAEQQKFQQMAGAIKVTVVAVKLKGKDTAHVKVAIERLPGRSNKLDLKLVRENGAWKVDHAAPNRKARRGANETATIATLRNILSAQAQFQATARADVDKDGVGEFGFFGELSGGVGVRGGANMNPPVLSGAFRAVNHGTVTRNGYHYRIYLPGKNAQGLVEPAKPDVIDAQRAETSFCVYAWPVEHGKTGTRTFFVNVQGDILATDAKKYSGANGPSASAAYKHGDAGPKDTMEGPVASGEKGNDGETWKQVG